MACAPGRHRDAARNACAACSAGDYCTGAAGATPEDCPAGHVCATPAAKEACAPGHFCPARATAQTPCRRGTFSQVERATREKTCVPCSDGLCCPPGSSAPGLCDGALSVFAVLALVVALLMAWLLGYLFYLRFRKRHPYALRVCNPVQVTALAMVGADFALDLMALGELPDDLPAQEKYHVHTRDPSRLFS